MKGLIAVYRPVSNNVNNPSAGSTIPDAGDRTDDRMAPRIPQPRTPSVTSSRSTRLASAAAAPADEPSRWGRGVQNREEQFALKRLAILRTAAQLFNEKGFYQTSLNDLARRLHVTKPTLYYYVENKNDILLQCLNEAMQQIEPAIAEAERIDGTGADKLRMFIQRYVAMCAGDFGRCLVLSGLAPLDEASREQLKPAYERIDRALRRIIRKGVADGSLVTTDQRMTTFSLFGAMHWITSWYRPDGALTHEQIAERMIELFLSGLLPRDPPSRRR